MPIGATRATASSTAPSRLGGSQRARFTRRYAAAGLVRGNEARLGQVFVNLLVNAADAIEEGSVDENEIRVETYVAPDGRIAVAVSPGPNSVTSVEFDVVSV